ncbi:MAG TPA: ECF-type sigma factor [Gemmataceae bacterium]|nr:ECF-type sigma factor [Gemmataceae bacterium]
MIEITRILSAIERGDPHAAELLLPLVCDELRKLANRSSLRRSRGRRFRRRP